MDKDEYNHFHGYQDAKDKHNENLRNRADSILEELWLKPNEVQNAAIESLGESDDYVTMLLYARKHKATTLLGELTLAIIEKYLCELATVEAEDSL